MERHGESDLLPIDSDVNNHAKIQIMLSHFTAPDKSDLQGSFAAKNRDLEIYDFEDPYFGLNDHRYMREQLYDIPNHYGSTQINRLSSTSQGLYPTDLFS